MKITTSGRYAVLALADMSSHTNGSSLILSKDIAKRQNLSITYVRSLLKMLKDAGLINSSTGVGGGYVLARAANTITIKSIFDAVNEDYSLGTNDTDSHIVSKEHASAEGCFKTLFKCIEKNLSETTIDQLAIYNK